MENNTKNVIGVPYAQANVNNDGLATATCPVCDHVSTGTSSKVAARAYAKHFQATHGPSAASPSR